MYHLSSEGWISTQLFQCCCVKSKTTLGFFRPNFVLIIVDGKIVLMGLGWLRRNLSVGVHVCLEAYNIASLTCDELSRIDM
jgi:hypothetical protein